MTQKSKTGRGGARANSGAKSSGIETVTVRIDKRLLNIVTIIKADFKNGKSLDDLTTKPTQKNDDAKLLREIEKLEHEKREAIDFWAKLCRELEVELESRKETYAIQISNLRTQIDLLKRDGYADTSKTIILGNLDDKLRKRLIQFCHPDKHQDERSKAIAVELVQELNKLGG